jgi:two-component system, LytTR family, sensor kinase
VSSSIPLRRIALVWCIVAVFAVLISTAQMWHLGVRGRAWVLVPLTFVAWLAWALLTPPIISLARRFPLARGSMGRAILVHMLVAFVCSALVGILWDGLSALVTWFTTANLPAGQRAPGYGPWRMLLNPAGHAMIGFVTYAGIVVAVWAMDAIARSQQAAIAAARLERDVALAREQAIKMQVHPHFLFNTLHAISVLITHDPPTATAMVMHLGDFLRATLARAHRAEVMVREELELLRHYLDVEQLRFGDRLTVSIDADDETSEALVPDLILQPIAENAIKHGVSSRPGKHRVVVRAHRAEGRLVLTVDDDGVATTASSRHEGIGLRATRERLAHLYGNDHEVTLTARAEGGMRATISLPYHLVSVTDPPADKGAEDDAA